MNIVVVSVEEPIYIFQFWNEVIQQLHEHVRKVYIVKPTVKGWKRRLYNVLYDVLLVLTLYQIGDVVRIIITYLFAWLRNEKPSHSLFSLASHYEIPVHFVESVNSETFREDLCRLSPDMVLAQVPMLVKKESLDIPTIGWVNKHFGLLPDYKGALPVLWAYWNREPEIGVSIHLMNESYDEGDILAQHAEPLKDDDTVPSILKRLNAVAANLVVGCVQGSPHWQPHVNRPGRYFKRPSMGQLMWHLVLDWRRRLPGISRQYLFTAAILIVALAFYLITANGYLYGDEHDYVIASRSLSTGQPFRDISETRQRPITSAPLFAVILSPLTGRGIMDLRALKVITALLTGGGLLFAYLWIRCYLRPGLWNLVLAAVSFNSLVFYLSHHLTTYALFFLLANASLYLLALYEQDRPRVLGPLAFLLGFMSLANYAGIGTFLGVMLYLLLRKKFKHFFLCGLVYTSVVGGWLVYLLLNTVLASPTSDTTFLYQRVFVERLVFDRGPLWLVLSLVGRMGWSLGSYALRNVPWLLLGWFFSDTSLVAFQPQYVLKMVLGIVPSALLMWGLVSRARAAWREKSALPAFYWPFLGHVFFIVTPSETSAIYLMPFLLPLLYFTWYGIEDVWHWVQRHRPGWKLDVARVVLAVLLALGIGNALLEARLVYLEAQMSSGKRVEPYTEHVLSVLLGKLELPRPYDWLHWLKAHTRPQDRAISFKFSRYTYLYLNQPGLDLTAYGARYEVADVEAALARYPEVTYMIVDAAPDSRPTNRVFETLVEQQPERFRLLFYSPYSEMAIYSVGPATP